VSGIAHLPLSIQEKIVVDPGTACWVWCASTRGGGYGSVRHDGRTRPAHRVAYELLVADVPEHLHLDHLCRNRACSNPAHLEVVTEKVNILRGVGPTAQNAAKTHCIHGHEFAGGNLGVYASGKRYCKACKVETDRRYWARRRAA
jgi:hypothetical protein